MHPATSKISVAVKILIAVVVFIVSISLISVLYFIARFVLYLSLTNI